MTTPRWEAIVFFDGPLSKWKGAPDDREVLTRYESRFRSIAEGWAKGRSKGLANTKFVVVARPPCDDDPGGGAVINGWTTTC